MQINQIAWWLVIIGALNWLWAGIFSQDLVGMIFGLTIISKLV